MLDISWEGGGGGFEGRSECFLSGNHDVVNQGSYPLDCAGLMKQSTS
jgi:hypothetical protein